MMHPNCPWAHTENEFRCEFLERAHRILPINDSLDSTCGFHAVLDGLPKTLSRAIKPSHCLKKISYVLRVISQEAFIAVRREQAIHN
jgi:hypothetical protein